MKTPTDASTGAFIIGFIKTRWISMPITNATAIVMKNATQYGTPASIRVSAM